MSVHPDILINDHLIELYLRFYRHGAKPALANPSLNAFEESDNLLTHWAFSDVVREFAKQVPFRRHEIQSHTRMDEGMHDAVIRGRLLSVKSVLAQEMTGNSMAVVFEEPSRSFSGGPNRVLIAVLHRAKQLLSHRRALVPTESTYFERIESALIDIASATRVAILEEPLRDISVRTRPTPGDLKAASRARQRIYRSAYDAYRFLLDIESGEPNAVRTLIAETVVAPLMVYQRFELLLAMAMAKALAAHLARRVELYPLVGAGPICRVERFAFYWQQQTEHYQAAALEPSEQRVRQVLEAYSIRVGSDRPDIVVVDEQRQTVVSIAEAKYFNPTSEDRTDAFRGAVSQLVRYARGYPGYSLANSVIGLAQLSADIKAVACPPTEPLAFDLPDMINGKMASWAARLVP